MTDTVRYPDQGEARRIYALPEGQQIVSKGDTGLDIIGIKSNIAGTLMISMTKDGGAYFPHYVNPGDVIIGRIVAVGSAATAVTTGDLIGLR